MTAALILSLPVSLKAQSTPPPVVPVQAQTPIAPVVHDIDLAAMDQSVKPCQDFYEYANGNWLTHTQIPADRAGWGTFSVGNARQQDIVHAILDSAAADHTAAIGSINQKVGALYRAGMDEATVNSLGAKPLADEFARIDAVSDLPTLAAEIGRLHCNEVDPAFSFSETQDSKNSSLQVADISQGGLGLPDRDYYTRTDEKSKQLRDQYIAHVAAMMQLLGDTPDQAVAEAKTVMAIETALAEASMTNVERRDPNAVYHPMTMARLATLAPAFPWETYFKSIGLNRETSIIVEQPKFVRQWNTMVMGVSISDWKTYLRWHLIHSMAPYLSAPFVAENFQFYGTTMSGTTQILPRWKRVSQVVDQEIGEGLGQLYVARAFSPQAKARAYSMVSNLRATLRDRLKVLPWMSAATRAQAVAKCDAIRIKVGYPNKWRDYSKLTIDNDASYATDVLNTKEFEFQRELDKIGEPVDHDEWGITPSTVNAYYDSNNNEIVFPAAILQPPFFDTSVDDPLIYGAIGAVIGHEMTHGFDDEGRQFDAKGDLHDWWTAADTKEFATRADAIAAQYDKYVAIEDLHVNGRLTLGENIADFGGLKIAYLAMEKAIGGKPRTKIDGFTPEQRFFIRFAQTWQEVDRPEMARMQTQTDPHSVSKYRVIGTTSNLPEFYKAFGCPVPLSAMKIAVW